MDKFLKNMGIAFLIIVGALALLWIYNHTDIRWRGEGGKVTVVTKTAPYWHKGVLVPQSPPEGWKTGRIGNNGDFFPGQPDSPSPTAVATTWENINDNWPLGVEDIGGKAQIKLITQGLGVLWDADNEWMWRQDNGKRIRAYDRWPNAHCDSPGRPSQWRNQPRNHPNMQ